MKTSSRFQTGIGVYCCAICSKKTRHEQAGLCGQCYELASIQNILFDSDVEGLKESGYDAKARAIFAKRPELAAQFTELHEAVK